MTVSGGAVVALNALIELRRAPTAPGVARRVVAGLLDGWGVRGPVLEDTAIVVNELVSNAVEHAGGEASLELAVSRYGDLLRISLADPSPVHPVELRVDHRAARGRGVHLIAVLCRRWGAEAHRGGKRVWCEITLRSA